MQSCLILVLTDFFDKIHYGLLNTAVNLLICFRLLLFHNVFETLSFAVKLCAQLSSIFGSILTSFCHLVSKCKITCLFVC